MYKYNPLKLLLSTLLALMLGIPASYASATVSIAPFNLFIHSAQSDANKPQLVKITNTTDQTAYVMIKVSRLVHAGFKDQKEIPYLSESPEKFGLIVSNDKMILPPYQMRQLRIQSLLKNLKEDAIYKILVYTVSPEKFDVPGAKKAKDIKTIHAGINIKVRYAIFVYVMPANPNHYDLSYSYQGGKFVVKNHGNSFTTVQNLYGCKLPPSKLKLGNSPFSPSLGADTKKNLIAKGCKLIGSNVVFSKATVPFDIKHFPYLVLQVYKDHQGHYFQVKDGKLLPITLAS